MFKVRITQGLRVIGFSFGTLEEAHKCYCKYADMYADDSTVQVVMH